MVDVVTDMMGNVYPEIITKKIYIKNVIESEEERFLMTLNDGLKLAEDLLTKTKQKGDTIFSGSDAFLLYDTYGFPVDLTDDLCIEMGLTLDQKGFETAMEEQRNRAKKAREQKGKGNLVPEEVLLNIDETLFVGYDQLLAEGKVLAFDEEYVILDTTPLYAESGGQMGDLGLIKSDHATFCVHETKKTPKGVVIHIGHFVEGTFMVGDLVTATVNEEVRRAVCRNHTSTHLLHKALKTVLGDHVNQAGSLVEDERLRFDFNHFKALSSEDLESIETMVNDLILQDIEAVTTLSTVEDAVQGGAMALFGEKYGQKVRVLTIGDFSKELCGGTHVRSTGQIGLFKILSEGSVGAGLRRIEAITGLKVLQELHKAEQKIAQVVAALKVNPDEVVTKAKDLTDKLKSLEKEIESLKAEKAKDNLTKLDILELDGFKAVITQVTASSIDELRTQADMIRDKVGSGVVLLGAIIDEKVHFIASVTKDLAGKRLHAGNIIKEVAKVAGGGGGGRPDMAQAGGKEPAKITEALDKGRSIIEGEVS